MTPVVLTMYLGKLPPLPTIRKYWQSSKIWYVPGIQESVISEINCLWLTQLKHIWVAKIKYWQIIVWNFDRIVFQGVMSWGHGIEHKQTAPGHPKQMES
jgi:hypothetical protein